MANEIWFRRGDGVEISCVEGSASHELMAKDGAFKQIELPVGVETAESATPEAADTPEAAGTPDYSGLKKDELLAKAAELGIDLVESEMTKAKILAAIEEQKNAGE